MHIDFPIRRTVQTKQLKPWQGVLFGLVFAIVGFSILNYGISSLKLYNEKNKTMYFFIRSSFLSYLLFY